MGIQRLLASQLSPAERSDLDAAIADPQRFHSDGREVGIAAIVLPFLLLLIEILLIADVASWHEHWYQYDNPLSGLIDGLPLSLLYLPLDSDFLYYAGIVVIPVVMIALAAYGLRTRGRHGYAFTSYGVVRVRGNALRLLRYQDIVE